MYAKHNAFIVFLSRSTTDARVADISITVYRIVLYIKNITESPSLLIHQYFLLPKILLHFKMTTETDVH